MKLTIEATEQITEIEGVEVRVWRGTTAKGVPCTAFVCRVAVDRAEDAREFDAELRETTPPSTKVTLLRALGL